MNSMQMLCRQKIVYRTSGTCRSETWGRVGGCSRGGSWERGAGATGRWVGPQHLQAAPEDAPTALDDAEGALDRLPRERLVVLIVILLRHAQGVAVREAPGGRRAVARQRCGWRVAAGAGQARTAVPVAGVPGKGVATWSLPT